MAANRGYLNVEVSGIATMTSPAYGTIPMNETPRQVRRLSPKHSLPAWSALPLWAMALFAVAPSVIVIILQVLEWVRGSVVPELDIGTLLMMPLLISIPNGPFVFVYLVVRRCLRAAWPPVSEVRLAMWAATVAMALPNLVIMFGTPEEMISTASDAGQGTGMFIAIELVAVPILGLVGWWIGRFIGFMRRRRWV
jgi:hypothetical protein